MIDEDARELADLRVRAYGPGADIHDDPEAVARLKELERRRRWMPAASGRSVETTSAHADAIRDPGRSAPPDGPTFGPPASDTGSLDVATSPRPLAGASVAATGTSATGTSSTRRHPRRTVVLWAASLVATAMVSAGIATWVSDGPSRHYATLAPLPDATESIISNVPSDFRAGTRFEAFYGMSIFTGELGGQTCLWVVPDAASDPGAIAGGCGPVGLPTIADLTVSTDPQSPSREAVDAFGVGAVIRFTLSGERVYVDLVRPTPAPA